MSIDPARDAARMVQHAIERRVHEISTSALVIIKTVKKDARGLPRTADVVLKHAPGVTIPGARLTFEPLLGHVIVPPVQEGDVWLCAFTYVPLDDLVIDKEARELEAHARWHDVTDAVLVKRLVTDNEDLPAPPSGYNASTDYLVMDKNGKGVWLKGNGQVVLGNLKGTLKRVTVEGDAVSGGVIQPGSSEVYVGQ